MMTLASIADRLGATLNHPVYAEIPITRVAAFSNAGPDAVVFIENASGLAAAIASGAGAILAPVSIQQEEPPLLTTTNPRLAFARLALLLKEPVITHAVHPSAVIHQPEWLGQNVTIGPNAVLESSLVGDETRIGAGCSVGRDVEIGRNCTIYPNVTIYPGTTIGNRVIIHAGAVLGSDGFGYVRDPDTGDYIQFPQQGTLVIEDDVEIGANTTIDRGALEETRIGRGTKLDNLVHIGHNVRIGSQVVIASQTGISGSCEIGDGAILGGQVGMGDHVTIGEDVILGGGSGILPHKNLRGAHQIFWGTPAKPLRQYLKELATLSKLTRRASGSGQEGK